MLLKELGRKPILVVDHPNKQKAIILQNIVRNVVEDLLIFQSVISDGYSSGWVCRWKLPRRVHCDHIEQSASVLLLSVGQFHKIELSYIDRERDAPELLDSSSFLILLFNHALVSFFLVGIIFFEEEFFKVLDLLATVNEHALNCGVFIGEVVNEKGLTFFIVFELCLFSIRSMFAGDSPFPLSLLMPSFLTLTFRENFNLQVVNNPFTFIFFFLDIEILVLGFLSSCPSLWTFFIVTAELDLVFVFIDRVDPIFSLNKNLAKRFVVNDFVLFFFKWLNTNLINFNLEERLVFHVKVSNLLETFLLVWDLDWVGDSFLSELFDCVLNTVVNDIVFEIFGVLTIVLLNLRHGSLLSQIKRLACLILLWKHHFNWWPILRDWRGSGSSFPFVSH